jgi:anti-sigma B factor antagonist
MMQSQPSLQITREGEKYMIKPGGDITASNVPEIRTSLKNLIGEGGRDLTIDLIDTHVIDSSGIGLLVAIYNSLSRLEGKVTVINATPELLGLFKAFRLDKHFPVSGIPGMQ